MNKTDFSEVNRAAKLLESYDKPWAIDFAILRKDQNVILKYLSSRGWDCFVVQIG